MEKEKKTDSKWYLDMVDRFLAVETPQQIIIEHEINQHLESDEVKMMVKAYQYLKNKTAIQGKTNKLKWRSNVKLELGLFRKLVRQKVGYLLSKEPTVSAEDKGTADYLTKQVFTKETYKTIKSLGQEAITKGIAYSIVYVNEEGELRLYKVPSEQIIPFWSDERRTELDAFCRIYEIEIWEKGVPVNRIQVEYWDEKGTTYYLTDAGKLTLDPRYKGPQPHYHYFDSTQEETGDLLWEKIPLIPWRYNEDDESLLVQVESLIDNLSLQASTNADLLADIPNFIYILKNYGGTDLDSFLDDLEDHRVISVDSDGGVDKLQAEINTVASEAEMERTRNYLYEAAAGIDTQDENLGNASGQALKWRYTDLDLDMNDMETEFQQSLERFMWFVEQHALNNGTALKLDTFKYIFNRDIIVNESEAIESALHSRGILDEQTIRENHPWYTPDVETRLKAEAERSRLRAPGYKNFPNEEEDVIEHGEE